MPTRAGVCLLMAEFEPLKPSNTGWLVADVVPDTLAFAWSRTAVDPALLALLADPRWQPLVVFPGEFAAPERVVTELPPATGGQARRPLFILLDGTWAEARKAFRKSPYLDRFPVLSLQPEQRLALQAAALVARTSFLHRAKWPRCAWRWRATCRRRRCWRPGWTCSAIAT